jgi:DNA-binding MarR family transcriptional regulator
MEKDILLEIKSLQNELIRKTFKEIKHVHNCQVSPVQMQIMDYLLKNNNKDIYQKDLENVLNVRKSTLSGVINTMTKNNIIKRVTSDKDLRNNKIVFTDEVLTKQKEMKIYFDKVNKIIVKGIDQNKIDIFLEVINLMKKNIIEDSEETK